MNEQQTFERIVAENVSNLGPLKPSAGAIERTITSANRKRQRPQWLALIKEPPMRSNSRTTVGSPTFRVLAIMAATLMLAVALAAAGAGAANVIGQGPIIVAQDGSGTYTAISEAVANAEDGDEILIRPGIYDESVEVTRDITLRGDGPREEVVIELSIPRPPGASGSTQDMPFALELIDADATVEHLTFRGNSSRIRISAGAPTLDDLHLDGIGMVWSLGTGTTSLPTGVEVNDGTTMTLSNSVLDEVDIDIENASTPTIADNQFTGGAVWSQGEGVDSTIVGNSFQDSPKWGVALYAGAHADISVNEFIGVAEGVALQSTGFGVADAEASAEVRDNVFNGGGKGVGTSGDVVVVVEDNTFSELSGTAIAAGRAGSSTVRGNAISGANIGISIGGSYPVEDNQVSGAERRGVVISAGSPRLRDNHICDNSENLFVADQADPDIDDSNTICADLPVE